MDVPGENERVIVALSVYHNGIIESVHEPQKRKASRDSSR
jgi:hypothetical protein